ncbi:LPD5 domain-containing protein [Bacteroides salyersiae]|uniref:LPD5 domain-containing protein n=1 Tax=uncultured Bacteroides sp. TaxID=162156 RepID=UPI0025D83ABF|nr:LPD5 domain-containing protein [uncultured Bacteroides sp.]MCS2956940.1 LPD5 domain-containing protein [Bacteroides salyersiae]
MEATNIKDFGQKIGGAKKDLASQHMERIRLITDDALITQPLSKVFPRPDFTRLYRDGEITVEQAINMQYLYNKIPAKPRSTSLKRWAATTMAYINLIKQILENNVPEELTKIIAGESYQTFLLEMTCANWPQEDYNSYPYKVGKSFFGFGQGAYFVSKGQRSYKHGTVQECVDWIKEQSGTPKKNDKLQCSIRYFLKTKEFFITPKGKPNVILKRGFPNSDTAYTFYQDNNEELKGIYDMIRFVPKERRNWNRPRLGSDHRKELDVSPAKFSSVFPFRGVEFGNWLSQVDRAASLNDAYDALMDLADTLGVSPEAITLEGQLALAFGARGSGSASAHYEPVKRVINLTKMKGAGALAHEWFHALDNYTCIRLGSRLSFASDICNDHIDNELMQAFRQLRSAIKSQPFCERSKECDEYRSKPYWGTMLEMAARAFEKYIIVKLDKLGWHNDYLVNIKSCLEYEVPAKYPYPTDKENEYLTPYFDQLLKVYFSTVLTEELIAV